MEKSQRAASTRPIARSAKTVPAPGAGLALICFVLAKTPLLSTMKSPAPLGAEPGHYREITNTACRFQVSSRFGSKFRLIETTPRAPFGGRGVEVDRHVDRERGANPCSTG
jgi:hypothetical protein